MKKLIFILVGMVMLCGMAQAATTQSTKESGTATTESITVITLLQNSLDILVINDSATLGEDIYFNPEGDLTIARITSEGWIIKPGEFVIFENFRSRRYHLASILGIPAYRVQTVTQ